MLIAAAQQNKSANKNKYNMLKPFDDTRKATKDKNIMIQLDSFL